MVTISHSEVESLLLCERKWFYGYGLSLEGVGSSDALTRGTMGHTCLETYFKALLSGSTYVEAEEETTAALLNMLDGNNGDLIKDLKRIFDVFFKVKPFKDYKILAVEKEFMVELSGDLHYPMIPDLIVQDMRRKVAVVDFKFIYDFYRPDVLSVLPQIPKYMAGLRILGKPADYGMYAMMRYRNLKNPEPNDIIRLSEIYPSDTRVTRTFEEQIVMTEKVMEFKNMTPEEQSARATRVGNKMVCESCSFKRLCSAELNGEDTDLILRSQFKLRERRQFSTESESS